MLGTSLGAEETANQIDINLWPCGISFLMEKKDNEK